jgi:hypothetical protein
VARAFLLGSVLLAVLAAGCGKTDNPTIEVPVIGAKGSQSKAPATLGFPVFATKNTTRIGGADPVADAAATAQAVYPSITPDERPKAIVLVDQHDWRAAIAASVLMAPPVRAPILLGDGTSLPAASSDALKALSPTGSDPAGGAQVIRVGNVARPPGMKTTDLVGRDDDQLARAIDAFQASAKGSSADSVVVASEDQPEYALPAAAWAAKSGDPVLFVHRDTMPAATRAAIAAHQQPRIYVLGPSSVISPKVTRVLRSLGTVIRVGGPDSAANAVAFARYADSGFGWGVVDPGHGLVFVNPSRPADAAAAAPLSASGTYGPMLLVDSHGGLPKTTGDYLLDIEPGYARDPTRGVYNHGWIIGDDHAVSVQTQAQIDTLLEIKQASNHLPSQP